MPQLHASYPTPPRTPPGVAETETPFVDHLVARARNGLHDAGLQAATAPTRVIEVGEITAGIAVPEHGGVRFFSSRRDFAPLDGTVFPSVEQAAKAARTRFRERTRPRPAPAKAAASRLPAV